MQSFGSMNARGVRLSRLTAIAILTTICGSAQGQCRYCGTKIESYHNVGMHYQVVVAVDYDAVYACISGIASAFGERTYIEFEDTPCINDVHVSPSDTPPGEGNCDNLLLVSSIGTNVLAGVLEVEASVQGTFGISSGYRDQSYDTYFESSDAYSAQDLVGTRYEDDRGLAIGAGSIQWVLPAGTGTFAVARGIDYGNNRVVFHPDFACEESGGPRTVTILRIDYAESILKVTVPGPAVTTWALQGGIVYYSDGSVTRLGSFLDSSFTPSISDGVLTVDGELSETRTIYQSTSGTTAVELMEQAYSLPRVSGDTDADGFLTQCDRVYVHNLQGAEIEDGVYNLRADLDLDGDIDSNDLDLATSLGCPGDFDCDGVKDFADYLAFLGAYDEQDSSADVNFDGLVNFSDYLAYLNYYEADCD